ncbi:MAG: outer membrane beta-barrel protein [Bacteroidota bacterium]|nr:outer membrane beta-barrel protein [Bacteroidota bacterium]
MNKITLQVTLYVLLFLLVPFYSRSQPASKWEVGPRISFSYNFRSYTRLFKSPVLENIVIEDNNESDIPKGSLNVGADIFYNFSRNFSVGSGIFISDKGFKTKIVPTCRPGPPPNCRGIFVSTLPDAIRYKEMFRFYYTSIPVYLRVQKYFGKTGFSLTMGASADFLSFYVVSITEYGKSGNTYVNNYTPINFDYGYDRVIVSSYSDISVNFPIKENLRLYVGPAFRFSSPFSTKSVIFYTNFYAASLEARLAKEGCLCKKNE